VILPLIGIATDRNMPARGAYARGWVTCVYWASWCPYPSQPAAESPATGTVRGSMNKAAKQPLA